jgi:hypothetical protein
MVRQSQFSCEAVERPGEAKAEMEPQAQPTRQAMSSPIDIFASTEIPSPAKRPLNIYCFDPSFGKFVGNYMTTSVNYEKARAGADWREVRGHRLRRLSADIL